jgi:ethanolamine utilization protein EutA
MRLSEPLPLPATGQLRSQSGFALHELGFDHLHPTDEEQKQLSDTIWSADNIELRTVGVDIGSSTSHLMFARVHLQRLAEALSSRFVVVAREILWRSPILLTPYLSGNTMDAEALADFISEAYREAGLTTDEIDSGAVILTGEALKRRNARAIANLFADQSGKFVCASAGHHLEAVMAAHGSGAVEYSRRHHKTVLNVDIGGGTTKLALAHGGRLLGHAAVAVGGRLVAFDSSGALARIEGPARAIAEAAGVRLGLGETLADRDREKLVEAMVDVLISATRLHAWHGLGKTLALTEPLPEAVRVDAVAFSGGVAEYIFGREREDLCDLGRDLAAKLVEALKDKRIPYPVYDPGHGIRATVIGASQFSVQVSGNTILIAGAGSLPLRNVPVVHLATRLEGDVDPDVIARDISGALESFDIVEGDAPAALAFRWQGDPSHARLFRLAQGIRRGFPRTCAGESPLILVMDGDIGRTLGEILRRELDVAGDIISIDGVQLKEFDYVDIGEIIEPTHVVPLVIKSLLFSAGDSANAASA